MRWLLGEEVEGASWSLSSCSKKPGVTSGPVIESSARGELCLMTANELCMHFAPNLSGERNTPPGDWDYDNGGVWASGHRTVGDAMLWKMMVGVHLWVPQDHTAFGDRDRAGIRSNRAHGWVDLKARTSSPKGNGGRRQTSERHGIWDG